MEIKCNEKHQVSKAVPSIMGQKQQRAAFNFLKKVRVLVQCADAFQCKHTVDKGKKVGTIFMDLSKAFHTLNDNLLLAKLNAYGFSLNAIKFVQSYLSEQFQRANINNNFREWCKIFLGVPQGLILGPLSFNIFINDISSLCKTLISATLLMIIYYIPLMIISKKLKLF